MQLSTVVILLALISVCWAQATLFAIGGKCLKRGDDTNSGVKKFQFGDFDLVGTSYSYYVVHSNGYVTLTNSGSTVVYDSSDIVDLSSLTNGPMIAAFWGDVDNRKGAGKIFYKETNRAYDLRKANMIIGNDFMATSLMVATWQSVGYFDRHSDKRNTFQVVLATGTGPSDSQTGPSEESQSYIIFLYNSIGWTTTDSATEDDTLPAQVGYTAGACDRSDTQYLPGFSASLNANISDLRRCLGNLPLNSNNGMPGVYVYRSDIPPCSSCTSVRIRPRVKMQGPYPIVADELVTPARSFPRVEMQGPYPIDEYVTRSQARAYALAHLSPHPEKTQLYEEDVEAMEMELDSFSNSPSASQ